MNDNGGLVIFGLITLLVSVFIYILPTIIARNKKNIGAIAALNILLGWTILGWVAALVWALTKEQQETIIVSMPQSSAPLFCENCGKYSPPNSLCCSSCKSPFILSHAS
jgi:Superinfection immunity protein